MTEEKINNKEESLLDYKIYTVKEIFDFYTIGSLYAPTLFSQEIDVFINCKGTVDIYCPHCDKVKTFSSSGSLHDFDKGFLVYGFGCVTCGYNLTSLIRLKRSQITVKATTTRGSFTKWVFELTKVGQTTAIKDLETYNLEKYRKHIDKEMLSELRTSIGLFSHGVGVGSLVYLRRIIENIIRNKILELREQEKISPEDEEKIASNQLRVTELISLISNYGTDLPKTLVDTKGLLYGLLSKGVHHFSDEECKQYYPLFRDIIFLIFNQIVTIKEERKLEEQITKDLNALNSMSGAN